jgi:hypothetical protein
MSVRRGLTGPTVPTEGVPICPERCLKDKRTKADNIHEYRIHFKMRNHTIHVTETAGFALLRVMKASCPIHGNVAFITAKPCGTLCATKEPNVLITPYHQSCYRPELRTHRSSSRNGAIIKQSIKNRTIISYIVWRHVSLVKYRHSCQLEKTDIYAAPLYTSSYWSVKCGLESRRIRPSGTASSHVWWLVLRAIWGKFQSVGISGTKFC